eukprot:PLAT12561.1.p1 GENE.PLAT12561.1~~PLAT12561.1.p1  ORF type:complete len:1383 (+),score=666.42 PLAT12561.1:269-4150(+)
MDKAKERVQISERKVEETMKRLWKADMQMDFMRGQLDRRKKDADERRKLYYMELLMLKNLIRKAGLDEQLKAMGFSGQPLAPDEEYDIDLRSPKEREEESSAREKTREQRRKEKREHSLAQRIELLEGDLLTANTMWAKFEAEALELRTAGEATTAELDALRADYSDLQRMMAALEEENAALKVPWWHPDGRGGASEIAAIQLALQAKEVRSRQVVQQIAELAGDSSIWPQVRQLLDSRMESTGVFTRCTTCHGLGMMRRVDEPASDDSQLKSALRELFTVRQQLKAAEASRDDMQEELDVLRASSKKPMMLSRSSQTDFKGPSPEQQRKVKLLETQLSGAKQDLRNMEAKCDRLRTQLEIARKRAERLRRENSGSVRVAGSSGRRRGGRNREPGSPSLGGTSLAESTVEDSSGGLSLLSPSADAPADGLHAMSSAGDGDGDDGEGGDGGDGTIADSLVSRGVTSSPIRSPTVSPPPVEPSRRRSADKLRKPRKRSSHGRRRSVHVPSAAAKRRAHGSGSGQRLAPPKRRRGRRRAGGRLSDASAKPEAVGLAVMGMTTTSHAGTSVATGMDEDDDYYSDYDEDDSAFSAAADRAGSAGDRPASSSATEPAGWGEGDTELLPAAAAAAARSEAGEDEEAASVAAASRSRRGSPIDSSRHPLPAMPAGDRRGQHGGRLRHPAPRPGHHRETAEERERRLDALYVGRRSPVGDEEMHMRGERADHRRLSYVIRHPEQETPFMTVTSYAVVHDDDDDDDDPRRPRSRPRSRGTDDGRRSPMSPVSPPMAFGLTAHGYETRVGESYTEAYVAAHPKRLSDVSDVSLPRGPLLKSPSPMGSTLPPSRLSSAYTMSPVPSSPSPRLRMGGTPVEEEAADARAVDSGRRSRSPLMRIGTHPSIMTAGTLPAAGRSASPAAASAAALSEEERDHARVMRLEGLLTELGDELLSIKAIRVAIEQEEDVAVSPELQAEYGKQAERQAELEEMILLLRAKLRSYRPAGSVEPERSDNAALLIGLTPMRRLLERHRRKGPHPVVDPDLLCVGEAKESAADASDAGSALSSTRWALLTRGLLMQAWQRRAARLEAEVRALWAAKQVEKEVASWHAQQRALLLQYSEVDEEGVDRALFITDFPDDYLGHFQPFPLRPVRFSAGGAHHVLRDPVKRPRSPRLDDGGLRGTSLTPVEVMGGQGRRSRAPPLSPVTSLASSAAARASSSSSHGRPPRPSSRARQVPPLPLPPARPSSVASSTPSVSARSAPMSGHEPRPPSLPPRPSSSASSPSTYGRRLVEASEVSGWR